MEFSWILWQVPSWFLVVLTFVAAVRSGGVPRVLIFVAAGLSLVSAALSATAYVTMDGNISLTTSLFNAASLSSIVSGVCLLTAVIIGRPGVSQGQPTWPGAQPYGQPYGQSYGSPYPYDGFTRPEDQR